MVVCSTYEKVEVGGEPRLVQRIRVVDDLGKVRYNAVAHASARAPLPDTFFARQNILYYIREERTLTAVNLSPTDAK
jgi:hypothetical protein